jgi:transposase
MFAVETYAAVRRFVFVEGKSRREAARVFGLSRDTIAKMCRYSAPPGYVRSKQPERPKLGPLVPVIDAILEADKTAPSKQRHTAKRIFERLRIEHGYAGGYTVVKDYVRIARARSREVFVPLAHPPGHGQVDFGECIGVIGGVRMKLHVFCFDLPQSDACFIKAYPAETTEAFLDGHVSAFAFFGGVPISILYDNLKIAVARILGGGRRQRTRAFTELVSHYLFQERFGRPGKGNDKGKVEALVKYSRANFLTPVPHAASFDALNAALEERCRARQSRARRPPRGNDRRKACRGSSGLARFARGALRALRQAPGEGLLDSAGALPHERLFRAGGLWFSRRPGQGLRRRGRDHLRRERDRPASARLWSWPVRLRPEALSGAPRAKARRARSSGSLAELGIAGAAPASAAAP